MRTHNIINQCLLTTFLLLSLPALCQDHSPEARRQKEIRDYVEVNIVKHTSETQGRTVLVTYDTYSLGFVMMLYRNNYNNEKKLRYDFDVIQILEFDANDSSTSKTLYLNFGGVWVNKAELTSIISWFDMIHENPDNHNLLLYFNRGEHAFKYMELKEGGFMAPHFEYNYMNGNIPSQRRFPLASDGFEQKLREAYSKIVELESTN